MLEEIARHPSDIARAAAEYLKSVDVSEKTKKLYEMVLTLFIDSLCHDPSAVAQGDSGEYQLINNWEDYYGGVIDGFLDWWLPRKWLGSDEIPARAPGILRKWIRWCYEHGYLEKERYNDFLEALPRNKSKEIKRLQKAGDLLYRLHSPDPGAWLRGDHNKVVQIHCVKEPEEWDEGYMEIIRFEGTSAYLENEDGEQLGPVMLSKELVRVLKIGDVINVGIGRFGKKWKVLESGNVYSNGTLF